MPDTATGPRAPSTPSDLVRVEATVGLSLEDTFRRFADEMHAWWPTESGLNAFHATVTRWDRPHQLAATWVPGSKVQVRFAEVDSDLTTVIIEHRGLDAHSPVDRQMIGGEDGWWGLLRAFVATVR